jgi:hypothetical protein
MKTEKAPVSEGQGDLVLREIWRIKNGLSAARGHDVHRLFADARRRQKISKRQVASFETAPRKD